MAVGEIETILNVAVELAVVVVVSAVVAAVGLASVEPQLAASSALPTSSASTRTTLGQAPVDTGPVDAGLVNAGPVAAGPAGLRILIPVAVVMHGRNLPHTNPSAGAVVLIDIRRPDLFPSWDFTVAGQCRIQTDFAEQSLA